MDEIKNREEFEVWLRSQSHVLNVGFNKATGKYLLHEDETAWKAWQASRQSALKEVKQMIDADWEDAADWLSLQLDG